MCTMGVSGPSGRALYGVSASEAGWLPDWCGHVPLLGTARGMHKAEYWLYTFTRSLQPITLYACGLSCLLPVERQMLIRLQAEGSAIQGLLTHCLQLPLQSPPCLAACTTVLATLGPSTSSRQCLKAPPRCTLQVQRLQRFATYGLLKQVVLKMIADELQDASADDNGSETTNMVITLRWGQLWEERPLLA